jgi:hypothetical protein
MQTVDTVLEGFGLSTATVARYKALQSKVYAGMPSLFVVLEDDNAEHMELNELSRKMQELRLWALVHRRTPVGGEVIALF